MYWRSFFNDGKAYRSCEPINLSGGVLLSHFSDYNLIIMKEAIYQQACYLDTQPVFLTVPIESLKYKAKVLPLLNESWNEYIHSNVGSFKYSVVSICYCIALSAVVTWFLNIFVLVHYTSKKNLLLKFSAILSSVYFMLTFILSLRHFHKQQLLGRLVGIEVIEFLESNVALNVLDLITVFFLQLNQVLIVSRLFERQSDKRLVFYVGIVAALLSQIIWIVVTFYHFSDNNEAGDILPAFIYLVRIVMEVSYAALISVFILTRLKHILPYKRIWLLTLLTLVVIYAPACFFVADVANVWASDLSEMLSVVVYDLCVVIPWAWCNEYGILMKAKEKKGVLGRRFYEDEFYELDRIQLFTSSSNSGDRSLGQLGAETINTSGVEMRNLTSETATKYSMDDNENTRNNNSMSDYNKEDSHIKKFKHTITHSLELAQDRFINLTDNFISFGWSIPRPVACSTGIPTESFPSKDSSPIRSLNSVTPSINLERNYLSSNRRHDVFVYSRKKADFDIPSNESNKDF